MASEVMQPNKEETMQSALQLNRLSSRPNGAWVPGLPRADCMLAARKRWLRNMALRYMRAEENRCDVDNWCCLCRN